VSDSIEFGRVITVVERMPHVFNVEASREPYDNAKAVAWRYDFSDKGSGMEFFIDVTHHLFARSFKSGEADIHDTCIKFGLHSIRRNPDEKNFSFGKREYDEFKERETLGGDAFEIVILEFYYAVYQQMPDQGVSMFDLMDNFNASMEDTSPWVKKLARKKFLVKAADSETYLMNRGGPEFITPYRVNPLEEQGIARALEAIQPKTTGHASVKVFLSYSHRNRSLAETVERSLEEYGIEAFLAHNDIDVAKEWADEILEQLHQCDVFIPIITAEFRRSDWTDQEVGCAVAHGKVIIPLTGDKQPHGFLSRYQALKRRREFRQSAHAIAEAISRRPELSSRLLDGLIRLFGEATNPVEAAERMERLISLDGYSRQQLVDICRHVIDNDSIHRCDSAAQLRVWIESRESLIESSLLRDAVSALS
jgi:nucleoside 2-deoxyribosyltransferase